jgi:AAA domain
MSVQVFNFEVEDDDEDPSRIRLVAFDNIELGTERRYLIKGLIPRSGLIVVWGPPKSGKSFKVLDIVMHVALNRPYRGRRVHPGTVIYCAFEGQTGIEARCTAFRKKFLGGHHETVPFYLEPVTLDLVKDAPELIRVIRRTLGDVKPAVVVLDTLNRSLRGSESSDQDMSAYVRAADSLREEFDCAVIIVHHCGVDSTRPRGHTSLTGAADAQLSVNRDAAANIVMTVEYMKDGPTGDTIVSRLENVEVGIDEDGDPITSCVVMPSETCGEATVKVTGAAKIALDVLYRAIADLPEEAPASARAPSGGRTTRLETWRRYCEAKLVPESDKPDTKRKAFVRACRRLQTAGIIDVWEDYVWLLDRRDK